MFADGSKVPYERTRLLIQNFAAAQGNAAAGRDRRPIPPRVLCRRAANTAPSTCRPIAPMWYGRFWSARACRPAMSLRVRQGRYLAAVSDDPSLAANRRVTITLYARRPAAAA